MIKVIIDAIIAVLFLIAGIYWRQGKENSIELLITLTLFAFAFALMMKKGN